MTLLLLSLGAGALTVLSPCVLPVLPFVFARPGSGRLFGGLALGFGGVMGLATAGGAWAASTHDLARTVALVLLAACGAALTWPTLAERWLRPLPSMAGRMERRGTGTRAADWLVGISTGLLWAPCAGPVLGLVLAGAALDANGTGTTLPLLAYAAGAALALLAVRLLVTQAGHRLPRLLRAAVPVAATTRRLAGVTVLAGVALITTGLDARLAVALPGLGLDRIEQSWLDRAAPPLPAAGPAPAESAAPMPASLTTAPVASAPAWVRVSTRSEPALPVLGSMPSLAGATGWLQSAPLRAEDLRGKVVLVDFWTFGCINCQRALPAVRAWSKRYRDEGLVVIGVHAPEFAYERVPRNVERAAGRMDLGFPIAIDNDFAIWNAWSNRYWPTLYLVDAQGRLRWRHIGEGAYAETEQAIRQLLDEARRSRPAT